MRGMKFTRQIAVGIKLGAAWSQVGDAVYLQESVKARHPQLLYESKLYKILQGGGESFCICRQLPKQALGQLSQLLLASCSWHPKSTLVWHRRGVQCDGDRLARSEFRGPVQLLQQEVDCEECAYAGRPDGEAAAYHKHATCRLVLAGGCMGMRHS